MKCLCNDCDGTVITRALFLTSHLLLLFSIEKVWCDTINAWLRRLAFENSSLRKQNRKHAVGPISSWDVRHYLDGECKALRWFNKQTTRRSDVCSILLPDKNWVDLGRAVSVAPTERSMESNCDSFGAMLISELAAYQQLQPTCGFEMTRICSAQTSRNLISYSF